MYEEFIRKMEEVSKLKNFCLTKKLEIQLCGDPSEAPNYSSPTIAAKLEKAIVVGKGMQSGKATVDLQFVDLHGNKFVTIVTGEILKGLVAAIEGVEQRG